MCGCARADHGERSDAFRIALETRSAVAYLINDIDIYLVLYDHGRITSCNYGSRYGNSTGRYGSNLTG